MTDRLKFALAQLNPVMGDFAGNVGLAREALEFARQGEADLLILPELFLTGYPPEDLVLRPAFQKASDKALGQLCDLTKDGPAILVGAPVVDEGKLYNAAVMLEGGEITAKRYKVILPNYGVFDEKRVFETGPMPGPVNFKGVRLGIAICEDIWTDEICECLEETGAEILISIHGSPYRHDVREERLNVAASRVTETHLPLIYLNQFGGQDELVFDGGSFVLNNDCTLGAQLHSFESETALVEMALDGETWSVDVAGIALYDEGEFEDYRALVVGLRDYVNKNGFKGVVLGLSGGIDSALSAAIAVDALGAERVRAVMLPYHYTSSDSLEDAAACAEALGIRYDVMPIEKAVEAVGDSLSPMIGNDEGGVTLENVQSRMRGLLLMALSNNSGDMLVTTGNKSEVSVGYATLYGDMNGGFNAIKDLYKTKVYALAKLRNRVLPAGCLGPRSEVIPERIITKAPTAELKENQLDQDRLPPYEVLDEILDCLVEQELLHEEIVQRGHSAELIAEIEQMLFLAEYKRRQAAPGVKISRKNFGRDRRYPITNKFREI